MTEAKNGRFSLEGFVDNSVEGSVHTNRPRSVGGAAILEGGWPDLLRCKASWIFSAALATHPHPLEGSVESSVEGSVEGSAEGSVKGSGSRARATSLRGGLVFKAHGRLYHSTLGLRVIKKKRRHRNVLKSKARTWLQEQIVKTAQLFLPHSAVDLFKRT